MPIVSELSSLVRQRRTEIGLTQDRLAEIVGVSRETINGLENGRLSNLTLDLAERLANALGLALGVFGSRWDVGDDSPLEIAGRTASVSYRDQMPGDVLREALEAEELPSRYRPHLRTLLDEAPIAVLSNVAREIEAAGGPRAKSTWVRMRRLAQALGCAREIWN